MYFYLDFARLESAMLFDVFSRSGCNDSSLSIEAVRLATMGEIW